MSGIADPAAESYAAAHTSAPERAMATLIADTHGSLASPGMLSGPVEGRLLELLVHGMQARRVLEIGTYSGFSALSMAAGLPADGRIITCEISQENAAFARRRIEASPHRERIELREGPALETVSALPGPFDLVFIDANKTGYLGYYEAVLPKLAPHGLIAVDNTLWSGSVIHAGPDSSDDTRALARFNDRIAADPRVVCVMLTVRDGITLIRKV
ncbi:MAG: O-methyltransferase [Solirubrobacteraceae bacterium]